MEKKIKFKTNIPDGYFEKDPIEQMVFKILDDFKDGTYDALMYGIKSETNKTHAYKQGYDFGVALYNNQIDEEVTPL